MKVFISWSGRVSHDVAVALHDWIPYVIAAAKPFVSTGDIEKGRRWSDVLGEELSHSVYGVICITPGNIKAPWLHFEAGAISKAIDKAYVSPFLFKVNPNSVQGPLQQFQFTVCERRDVLSLMQSINGRIAEDSRLTAEQLEEQFEVWWPKLDARLAEIAKSADGESRTGYEWLYTLDDLGALHREQRCKALWWITPRPYKYVMAPTSQKLIGAGLDQGIAYDFVVPNSSSMEQGKEVLLGLARGKAGTLHVSEIQTDEFRSSAVTDYIVVDPDTPAVQVFLELPLSERGFWIKVDEEAALDLVVRFRKLVGREVAPA